MNFFDIDAFFSAVGVIPVVIATPINLIFNIILIIVTLDLGNYVWVIIIVFLIAAIAIFFLNNVIIKKRLAMNITISGRAMILSEMIPNMIRIKLHSLENFFRRRLDENRVLEIKYTKITQLLTTLMQFCFYSSPLIASCGLVLLYNLVSP